MVFSPHLKKDLIESGRLSEINSVNDYPDAALVKTCVEQRLDLPSIRRVLLGLNLPVEMAAPMESQGIAALPSLEQAAGKPSKKSMCLLAQLTYRWRSISRDRVGSADPRTAEQGLCAVAWRRSGGVRLYWCKARRKL